MFTDLKSGKEVELFRPTVPIIIVYKGSPSWDFQALVDSGSDRNLFPAKIGESVGIDVKKGKVMPIRGIGSHDIVAYTHKVKILIGSCSFEAEVDFSYEQQSPLLGRCGFFDAFKNISFGEKRKEVIFKP